MNVNRWSQALSNFRIRAELTEHLRVMSSDQYDVELLLKVKQGQLDVPQAAVVTDFSDSLVVNSEIVESR